MSGAAERTVLALLATSDRWLSAQEIQRRLGLPHAAVAAALRDLVRCGDLDWDGVVHGEIDFSSSRAVRYHLPLREVRFGRRIVEGAA